MFALAKRIRGQWQYLTYSGHFRGHSCETWSMDSETARKVQSRHRDCEIVLMLANGSRPQQQAARAGFADLSAIVLLAGMSAMAYAIFSTVFSFGTILQF